MLKKNVNVMSVMVCSVILGSSVHAVRKNITPPDDQPKITQWLSPAAKAFARKQEEEQQKKAADLKRQKEIAKASYWKTYDYQIKTDLYKGD